MVKGRDFSLLGGFLIENETFSDMNSFFSKLNTKEIKYEQTKKYLYKIYLEGDSSERGFLVFQERFNKFWNLEPNSKEYEHLRVFPYGNAYFLDDSLSNKLKITFSYQYINNILVFISSFTFISLCGLLLKWLYEEKKLS